MVDCYTLMVNGDLLNAAVCPFTNVPNFGAFFYLLVVLALELAIYFKTQDMTMPTILGVILGIVMTAYLPAIFYSGAIILIAINLAVIIFNLYMKRRQ